MIAAAEGEPDQSMTTVAADCPDAGLVFAEEHGSPPDSYAPGCPDREQLRNADLESAQENTAMFEVMEAAVNAGHIHQGQNPCTPVPASYGTSSSCRMIGAAVRSERPWLSSIRRPRDAACLVLPVGAIPGGVSCRRGERRAGPHPYQGATTPAPRDAPNHPRAREGRFGGGRVDGG